MRPDPAQTVLDERIALSSIEERIAWNEERRQLGHQLVWEQVESAGLTDPLEQADFLLRRLYPEMPEAWFEECLAKLTGLRAAGKLHGFERPGGDS